MNWEFNKFNDINERDPWFDDDFDNDEIPTMRCHRCNRLIEMNHKWHRNKIGAVVHNNCLSPEED